MNKIETIKNFVARTNERRPIALKIAVAAAAIGVGVDTYAAMTAPTGVASVAAKAAGVVSLGVGAVAGAISAGASALGITTFLAAGVTPILNLGGVAATVAGAQGFVAGSAPFASALIACGAIALPAALIGGGLLLGAAFLAPAAAPLFILGKVAAVGGFLTTIGLFIETAVLDYFNKGEK